MFLIIQINERYECFGGQSIGKILNSALESIRTRRENAAKNTIKDIWNTSQILYAQLVIHFDSEISWKQDASFDVRLLLQKISTFGVNSFDAGIAILSCITFISIAWISQACDMIRNTIDVKNAISLFIISFVKYGILSLAQLRILLFLFGCRM